MEAMTLSPATKQRISVPPASSMNSWTRMLAFNPRKASMTLSLPPCWPSHDHTDSLSAFKKLQNKRCSFDQFDHIPGVVWAVGKSGYWHTDAFSGQKLETSQLVFGSSNRGRFIQAIHSHHFELSQDSQSIKGNGGANARNDSIEPIQPFLRVIDFWSMGRDAQIAF